MQSAGSIGKKIAIARKLKSLSQTEIASRLSVTPQAVGKWERGESLPDVYTLELLANILDVDLNYFSNSYSAPPEVRSASRSNHTSIQKFNLSYTNWQDADFSGICTLGDKISFANINNCKFIQSDLFGLKLSGNHLVSSDFSRANLAHCHFDGCSIESTCFENALFSDASLDVVTVSNCNFKQADFSNATFRMCTFKKNDLQDSRWDSTTISASYFRDITFTGTMENCIFDTCRPVRVVFSNIIFRNTFFKNCNMKTVSFENCRADRITLSFLKACKADIRNIMTCE